MKRLLKIGLTDSICSLMPILMWYLLGIFYDERYSNMFTLTYAFQFIYNFLCSSFVSGSLKYEKKYKIEDHNSTYSGIISGLGVFLVIVSCVVLFNKNILSYYNLDYDTYRLIYIFGILNLVFDFLINSLKTLLQYDEEDKFAFNVSLIYYCSKVLYVILLRLVFKDITSFMICHLVLLCITVLFLYYKYSRSIFHFKFNLKLVESLKYSLISIPQNVGMLVIYGLGISRVTCDSAIYLASYNAVAMSTDVQWDILYSAIDTNASIEVCNDNFDKKKKKLLFNSCLYSIFLMLTSIVMILFLNQTVDGLDLKDMFIIFFLECSWFPLYSIRYVTDAWLSIKHPCKSLFIISTLLYVNRTVLSLVLGSKYALSIAVLVNALLAFAAYISMYLIKRRQNKESISVE